jgi:hypothetical protein
LLAVDSDVRNPLAFALIPNDALDARLIVGIPAPVLMVLRDCRLAKVAPSIVGPVEIYVVDLGFWPCAGRAEEGETSAA